MNKIENFIKQSSQKVQQKTLSAFNILANDFEIYQNKSQQNQKSFEQISKEELNNDDRQNKELIANEKVLEINMIQSGYIPYSEEKIDLTQQISQKQKFQEIRKQGNGHKNIKINVNSSRVDDKEEEKKRILNQLKKLDEEIAQIKGEETEDTVLKRKQKLIQQQQARQRAQELVRQLKLQKKQIEQRKRRDAEKSFILLKQEQNERKKIKQEQLARIKQQKRLAIQKRMQEQRKKREERKLIEKQSNKLIVQLKRQEQLLKKKQNLIPQIIQNQQKRILGNQKRPQINLREIQQHQRKYMAMKSQQKQLKRDRSESIKVNHQIMRYQKNVWSEQLQEQQFKRRQEQKQKQIQKKLQLQKRLKYGQLVKNIFLPKKRETYETEVQNNTAKPTTPDINDNSLLPKISESEKRVTQTKMRKKLSSKPGFSTAQDYKKSKIVSEAKVEHQVEQDEIEKLKKLKEYELRKQTKDRLKRMEKTQTDLVPNSGKKNLYKIGQNKIKNSQDLERNIKFEQIRKQTNERLKKLQNMSIERAPSSKPKYQNYLGHVKINKKEEAESWKKIINDNKLSKQEKYNEMLKKATSMEKKARMKEQLRKDGDEDAVNLYIGSIQAKLALLQKF